MGRATADSFAKLGLVQLAGTRTAISLSRAEHYMLRAVELDSPGGQHLHALLLEMLIARSSGIRASTTSSAHNSTVLRELAVAKHYLPALRAHGFRKLFVQGDCAAALSLYRSAALQAMKIVETAFLDDYSSLPSLTLTRDAVREEAASRAARDAETVQYWGFQADQRDSHAFYELGRIYQTGSLGMRRNMQKATGIRDT
jgi:TPR repeat protein